MYWPNYNVLGVRIDAVQIPDVISQMESWIQDPSGSNFIAVTGMHGTTEAQRDPSFKHILNTANLVVPDGMSLVWLGRWQGYPLKRRVYGPELMDTFCRDTGDRYRHFFYGGLPIIVEHLVDILQKRYKLRIVGTYTPPFRPLTFEEDVQVIDLINKAHPDVLWVGLSTPKQERWMYEHRDKLKVPVMVGVGAAFDFLAGIKSQAPKWMQEHGLEWFWRLIHEPRRLWRRYLVYGSLFVVLVALEKVGILKFD